ncbi:hypothetical protein CWE15_01655 [Aliidiomarina taiwanensis]|uniref:Type II secretion system protein GspF domain-containing protein n=1 Tax=Aliidiomarina taiwanensis TaxID=946228 RepID=A0A432X9C6_9GAMM|nr:type II secretion system F family protein [Aliidiomarina taiwanensis]RUO43916.1 hypothetical protein CWE15_01655 [Aliidiomarina taiwanensis]
MAWLIILSIWLLSSILMGGAWVLFKRLVAHVEHKYEVRLQKGLTELFMFLSARQLLVLWLCALLFMLLAMIVLQRSVFVSMCCLLATLALPPLGYRHLVRRRRQRFVAQLPDACMLIANALRTGSSISNALFFVRTHAAAPLSQEFSILARSLRLGASLSEALASLYQRLPSDELERVVTGLLLGQDSGGQQARLLEKIAASLRARAQLSRRVQSLSAQGRLQGNVMSALPFFLSAALWFLEPAAMRQLMHSLFGWVLLGSMLLLISIGHWLIYKTVRIEVPL